MLAAWRLRERHLKVSFDPPEIAAQKLARDELDAFFFVGGPPVPLMLNLIARKQARLVSIDGDGALLNQRIRVRVSDRHGRPVKLGAYLGATGHITAFHAATGAMTHLHPIGVPVIEHDAAVLTLHTFLTLPGTYVFFVQVRVDGFLHTLRAIADLT